MDCSICVCPMNQEKKLPCGHSFCSVCIAKWLVKKPTCPLCRLNCADFTVEWSQDIEAPLILQFCYSDCDQWTTLLDDDDGPPPLLEESFQQSEPPTTPYRLLSLSQDEVQRPTEGYATRPLVRSPNVSPVPVEEFISLPSTLEALGDWFNHDNSYFTTQPDEIVIFNPSQIETGSEAEDQDYDDMWDEIAQLNTLLEA